MRRLFTLMFCVLAFGLMAETSHAQAFSDNGAFAPAKFGENNQQLKAVLDLQYQLQILKRMIEREKSVNSMVDSALAIGIEHPQIPKPDHTLCLQVPANIACAMAYKDMYTGYSVEPVKHDMAVASDNKIPSMAAGDLPPLPLTGLSVPKNGTLYWTTVTCLQADCSAVITPDPNDPRARYRVMLGDKLADGATVSRISASGVVLTSHSDKPVVLEPAPKA